MPWLEHTGPSLLAACVLGAQSVTLCILLFVWDTVVAISKTLLLVTVDDQSSAAASLVALVFLTQCAAGS